MKKNIIICGLIAGPISLIGFLAMGTNMDFDKGMIYGYTSMLLAFSLIFVAVKNYRDKHNNGGVTFGTAFKMGFFITLIASTIYVITWLIDYYFFIPDFGEKYMAHELARMRADGIPEADIAKKATEMKDFMKLYHDYPIVNALFTYLEILPVGVVVSLICAAILKRKPDQENIMNPDIL